MRNFFSGFSDFHFCAAKSQDTEEPANKINSIGLFDETSSTRLESGVAPLSLDREVK